MSLKEACIIASAIGAGAIMSNKPDTDEQDPEDKGQVGISQETEFSRRMQDIYTFLTRAFDPSEPNHWQVSPGFDAVDSAHATATSGPFGDLVKQLGPAIAAAGGITGLVTLIQGLAGGAKAPTTTGPALPPLNPK